MRPLKSAQPRPFKRQKLARVRRAAQLSQEGDLTIDEIAAMLAVSVSTITRWKHRPEFVAEYAACREAYERAAQTKLRRRLGL